MENISILFAADDRQRHLGEALAGKNIRKLPGEWKECVKIAEAAESIILPTPVSVVLTDPFFGQLKDRIRPGQTVFGGKFPEGLQRELEERGIRVCDLMEDPQVVLENAAVTAEAVVSELIARSRVIVEGQTVVIVGFGRCARRIAEKLSALGGHIRVLARNENARSDAKRCGYEAGDFWQSKELILGADTVINTVPARLIAEKELVRMDKNTLVMDIASYPGGYDEEAAKNSGIDIVRLPGLPARYETLTAGRILAAAISRERSREGREEELWIYQVSPSDLG